MAVEHCDTSHLPSEDLNPDEATGSHHPVAHLPHFLVPVELLALVMLPQEDVSSFHLGN